LIRRVAIVADSHFDEHSRFEECCRLHQWIEGDLAARGVDLVLHAGDVYERKSTPHERIMVAEWLCDVARTAPVVIVRGNHDAREDLELLGQLRSHHPIRVEEAAGVHVLAGVAVGALAWPRKAELLAKLGHDVGLEESGAIAGDALRNVIRGLGQKLAQHDGPTILLAHAMVRGSITSTGQPLVGCDMEIGVEDLGLAGAGLVAIGHIHKGQEWTYGDTPIVYPGSPRRTAFGELEEKGYVLATFDGPRLLTWERVVVPATPMLLLEADYAGGQLCRATFESLEALRGAEVRFRYTTPADQRDAARREANEVRDLIIGAGAVSVKVEEVVVAETRARAPGVATAPTVQEKLVALWAAKGIEMDARRRERLLGMAGSLEAA